MTKKEVLKNLLILFIRIIITIIMFFIIFKFIFGLSRVTNQYMEPSIKSGDLLLFYRLDKAYEKGDAVVLKSGVFRVVAKEGDTVDINNENKVLVNGHLEDTKVYYLTKKEDDSKIKFPVTIKKDEYFVLGDYRDLIKDSRIFGTVNSKDIKGKVIAKLQTRNI